MSKIELYKGECLDVVYAVDLTIEEEKKTLEFSIPLAQLESDICIYGILEECLENYVQDNYCSCSFNEDQNHCDCEIQYNWEYDFKRISATVVEKGLL